jgi:tRNA G18 (ribose-2'-O)-methylase SpoU
MNVAKDIAGNIPFGEDPLIGITSKGSSLLTTEESTRVPIASSPILSSSADLQMFQQKMDPWDLQLLDQDIESIRQQREVSRKRVDGFDMILVASLLDRIPNLAGLSRTCEIFGVTSLVLPSRALTEDPAFKGISMTSECWLDIVECRPNDLPMFIEQRRLDDYRIIAVEQSSQSHNLLHYQFPPRCILILGNENQGIPAEILHLVDDCIEIPQYGVIRSLNVHVSGSLVLWEARRQHELHLQRK